MRPSRRRPWRALLPLAVLAGLAALAPWLSPYPPDAQLDIVALRTQPPSWAHPFGTDAFGRDVLSRVLHGARDIDAMFNPE